MTSKSSAGDPPAVARTSRPRFGSVNIRDRGRLPHWEADAATYFITFRLADSLPQSVLNRIIGEREDTLKTAAQLGRSLSRDERLKIQRLSTQKIEKYLDSGMGKCYLRKPTIANIVADGIRHFDAKRYRLFAWCVMPNHVHLVARLFPGQKLAGIVHSWKSFSAKEANKLLGLSGTFWQREYYDHLIRDDGELERALRYVANNPTKAGLKNWTWIWVWGQHAPTTAGEDAGATVEDV